MIHQKALSSTDLERLSALDTCTVSNAIERLNVRLRNEGFVSGVVQSRFPKLPPMIGYAATGRIRTASPPMTHRCYYDRMDWWTYVASLPKPRVLVLQDAVIPGPVWELLWGKYTQPSPRRWSVWAARYERGRARCFSSPRGDGLSTVRRQRFRIPLVCPHHRVRGTS